MKINFVFNVSILTQKYSLHALVLFCILAISCRNPYIKVEKAFSPVANTLFANRQIKNTVVVLTPLDGCAPCIDSCIKLSETPPFDTSVYHVFASVWGQKTITSRLSQKSMLNKNVVIDDIALIVDQKLVESTPTALFFDSEGKIIAHYFITWQNYPQALDSISRFFLERQLSSEIVKQLISRLVLKNPC